MLRRGGLVVAALVAGTAIVLAVEIQLARSGGRLPHIELALDRPGTGPGARIRLRLAHAITLRQPPGTVVLRRE